jgi:surfeit locus 1 family protein
MSNSKAFIKLGVWHFTPKLKLSIISLILCSILAYLGTWQLDRAAYKKNISAHLQEKTNNFLVALESLQDPNLTTDRFTKVQFAGQFINELTFLLDNQMYNHKPGYKVLTVAKSQQLEKWVLVDRGWIALGTNRNSLPEITALEGNVQVDGIINTIPTGIALQKDTLTLNQTGPFVIQTLDYKLLNTVLPHEIFDFVVQLQSTDLTSYTITDINFGVSQYKHMGYAVQWYCFALLVLIYYMIVTIKKDA